MVSRTGGVGSIGVIAMHVDQTARDAQQGYRYTPITAGDHKNDFSPHEKLGPEAHARLQAEVDRLYSMFVDHVAAMRKLDADAVRATEAGIYFGMDAVTAGLADAVGSLDAVLAEFSSFLVARRARGHTMSDSTRLSAVTPSTLMENATMPLTDPVDHPVTDEPVPSAAPEADKPVADETSPATTDASRADAVAIAELCQLAGHPAEIKHRQNFMPIGNVAPCDRRSFLLGLNELPAPAGEAVRQARSRGCLPLPRGLGVRGCFAWERFPRKAGI